MRIKILAIETSCDDTAIAIGELDQARNSLKLLKSEISSQTSIHAKYGGVVPNLSAREHLKNFKPLLEKILKDLNLSLKDINLISISPGPGLIPALLVGTSIAKSLVYYFKKPLVANHHLEGHIYANWLTKIKNFKTKKEEYRLSQNIEFPLITLVVSGGHTQLVLMKDHLDYQILGETLDDAAGEAFDKVARILNLGFPGGPIISKLAKQGNPKVFDLPRPMLKSDNLDFSFSGLKTAVLYLKEKLTKKSNLSEEQLKDLTASFQQAIVDVLIAKIRKAVQKYQPRSVALAGGVSANQNLRAEFLKLEKSNRLKVKAYLPDLAFCMDNAAMQLPVVYYKLKKYPLSSFKDNWRKVTAKADLELS
jgi:N6-L-threonylcarbamoyladenine synthase